MVDVRNTDGPVGLRQVARSLAPVTLLVQACSFLSSLALAHYFGPSVPADAYYLAISIPVLTYGVVLGAIRVGAIPALSDVEATADGDGFRQAVGELLAAVVLAALVFGLATTLIAVVSLPALSNSNNEEAIALARTLVLELFPLTLLGALTGALGAVLTVKRHFVAPIAVMACEPLMRVGLLLVFGAALGGHGLALANVAGNALAAMVLWILLRRVLGPVRPRRPFGSSFLRDIVTVSTPLLIAQLVLQANPIVDRLMTVPLATGSITVLELGYRMFGISTVLLGSTLIAPVTATWAARFVASGWEALRDSARNAVRLAVLLTLPLVGISLVLQHDVIAFAYSGGAFDARAEAATAETFSLFMLGLPANIAVVAFASIFVVRRDPWIPAAIAVANVFLNAALNVVLRQGLGVAGIALSTSLTVTLLGTVYGIVVYRRYGDIGFREIGGVAAKALLATGLAVVVANLTLGVLPAADDRLAAGLRVSLGLVVGALTYAGASASLGEREPLHLLGALIRRLRNAL